MLRRKEWLCYAPCINFWIIRRFSMPPVSLRIIGKEDALALRTDPHQYDEDAAIDQFCLFSAEYSLIGHGITTSYHPDVINERSTAMKLSHVMALTWILSLTAILPAMAADMRCGNDFVKIGDRAFMVEHKCGEPVSKEFIGYTLDEAKNREYAIEEWVYGPMNGIFYFVKFIGGSVTEIEYERQ